MLFYFVKKGGRSFIKRFGKQTPVDNPLTLNMNVHFIQATCQAYTMKYSLLIGLCFSMMSFTVWQPDFESARHIAKEKHQLILLNFSGSDWCGPCIRMRKEIFENEQFSKMADTTLVLINADFPRNKKNQLGNKFKTQNEALADKYNPGGKFPFTVLLDANGKVIKEWDGLPNGNAAQFTQQVKNICDAVK
jgi:thioredoxin-related protein